MATAIDRIKQSRTYWGKKLAFEFLILTGARTSEVRMARWNEIDFKSRTWTQLAAHTKAGREHRVPLSNKAIEILSQALTYSNTSDGLIFKDAKGKMLNQNALRQLLRRYHNATMHGMRSAFRDWAAEMTDYPREIAEYALAHLEGSDTERAYRRTDYFDKRRELMQDWSDYLAG